MRQKNKLLAGILVSCLAVCGLLALVFSPTPGTSTAGQVTDSGGLCISELCAKNDTVLPDNSGAYPDYIELYNGGAPISLRGYTLTDGFAKSEPLGDIFMDTGDYRVLFLGNDHTGFSLGAAGGDYIQLLDAAGKLVAQATVMASAEDQVMVLSGGGYVLSHQPSPGFSNDAAGIAAFRQGDANGEMALTVSEVLLTNDSSLPDEKGAFCDVVELHNPGSADVSLMGWCLSDSTENRYRYRLPNVTVPAGGYLLLYCDGEDYISDSGLIHTNFGISIGETLCLTDPKGSYRAVETLYPGTDVSLVRLEDGSYTAGAVSLGYGNDAAGEVLFAAARVDTDSPLVISEVLLSSAGVPYQGALTDVIELYNRSGSGVSTAGWYLTDDSDPYKYALPEMTLEAGQYLVIPCGRAQTGFALSEGETLRLTAPSFRHAPEVLCVAGDAGCSISLQGAEEAAYRYATVTLGYENAEENHERFMGELLPDGLRISEVMSSNYSYLQGAYGNACDWIELYNGSDSPISLSDYTLTDNSADLTKFPMPNVSVAPGQYLCVLLTEETVNLPTGYSRMELTLSAAGEELYLCRNGAVVDFALLPELDTDISYGRAAGNAAFSLLEKPTPGQSNSAAAQPSEAVTALTAPGSYNGVDYLDIELSAPGEIFYTTDCTAPTQNSHRYTGAVRVSKTTVIRAVCYEAGKTASKVTDLTYLLNENDSLSVISIVSEPEGIWSYNTGIYVDGPGWTPGYPYHGANFWNDWERAATVSLLDGKEEGFVSVGCGLKIFGGFSRGQEKKSFSCMFRRVYGESELAYPIFGEEGLETYEALVLRAGGQESNTNRIKDEVLTSYIHQQLGIPVQKYRPVALYLNGSYFGIYFIREKLNEHYVAGNYDTNAEKVQLTYWSGRDNESYAALLDFVKKNGVEGQAEFDYVASKVDIDNYTDYVIAQMWIANHDTANVKFFSTEEMPWTWILFDTDLAMRHVDSDTVSLHLEKGQIYGEDRNCKALMIYLLRNESYRERFIKRIAWQVEHIWGSEQFLAHLDSVVAQVDADMEKECDRWGDTYGFWQACVGEMRSFAKKRLPYFLDSVQRYFRLTDAQMRAYGFPMEG
ncbi:MAG: lamin tail domain-containing protein [Oscillospiraceae bacterium]|nr:lamin tail domain-containing protein [Oscillospiraceae bacterium]